MKLKKLKDEDLMVFNYVYFWENNEKTTIAQVIGVGDFGSVGYVNVEGIYLCDFDYTERILDCWQRDVFAIPIEDIVLRISEESKNVMLRNNIDIKFVLKEKVESVNVYFNDFEINIKYLHDLQNFVKSLSGYTVVLNGL
jgi:hypothetical protein